LQYWKRQQISRFTMRKIIQTNAAPKAIGPYSQAVLVDDRTLYISGQLGLCPSTMELIDGGADEQCKQALMNMGEILKAAGATYNDGDIENYNKSIEIYVGMHLNFQRKLSRSIRFSSSCTTEGSAVQWNFLEKIIIAYIIFVCSRMRTLKLKLLLWWDRTNETTLLGNNLG
ncbi:Ribonuclease, partial [Trichinella sp. T6]